ncbi:hypothetical protein WOLCODRAFT_132541 [Wolfiporia cocos MD-104 SS10]|uniref:F-box domain-containing protein n=1 Tax=Wolfiporia cocos (strain MD-104) TaxID=742152 RepID=A0A2H3JKY3_WOLCO|nr:hypothetical protein WOLCODRAFT_132541 [Wolfiporia cocos MD-104 SS10]
MSTENYDILICIFDRLQNDRKTLFQCSLVSRAFSDAVSRVLYREVTFSPPFTRALDLRRKDEFSEGMLYSASLPHHAQQVLRFELSGYPSARPAPLNSLASHLKTVIGLWSNLTTLVFAPKQYHEQLFIEALPLLANCKFLRDLTVNASCMQETQAALLTRLEGLERVALQNPTRAMLDLLPEWLSRLSPSLRGLHLQENCGSITPGVLRSFLPHLGRVSAFTLGLSYSLADSDVFAFLNELQNLHTLDIRYYLQLRPPTTVPRLTQLRSLTVRYTSVSTVDHAGYLCKWIRRAVAYAPLSKLHLACEEENRGAAVRFDGLLAHLSQKHATRLRELRMDTAFVGKDALRELCMSCVKLQEIAIAVSANVLAELPEIFEPLDDLLTARIETRNAKRNRISLDVQGVSDFLHRGPPHLRRLAINGVYWERVSNADQQISFVVGKSDV